MDEKTKLYFFTRVEIALIFFFMLVIATTSFIFGVKLGRSFSFQDANLEMEDRERVDFMSEEEEKVNNIVKEEQISDPNAKIKAYDYNSRLERKIREEIFKEEKSKKSKNNKKSIAPPKASAPVSAPAPVKKAKLKKEHTGKYTIQIGSYRTSKEAEDFADGFRVRGYKPIIREVVLSERGTWFRVSIGVFENVDQAKNFAKDENSLFQGQDHVIARFD